MCNIICVLNDLCHYTGVFIISGCLWLGISAGIDHIFNMFRG